MIRIIHPVAGATAIALISIFWLSTTLSELLASQAIVISVKTAIPWGFLLLVPALVATGGSGVALAKGRRKGVVGSKVKRMPFIAANGVIILIPSAFFLAFKAEAAELDTGFFAVQALELIAGGANITLLCISMRDGLNMTRWKRTGFLRPARIDTTVPTRQEEVATGTTAFYFQKPEGFEFAAGQAVYLTLINPPENDQGGRIRTFSIASAPQERELMIATRMSDSSFKRVLKSLPPGKGLEIEGPLGNMSLHKDPTRPAVFLAGGIGITPFRSVVIDATRRKLSYPLFLFYSNRSPEDAAFLSELFELEKQNPCFKLIATMTGEEEANRDWNGERGYITKDMLLRHMKSITGPTYYIAGPIEMTSAMDNMLKNLGVKNEDVRLEAFSGYLIRRNSS
jgi:ferredoxin-NADP reductase